MSTEALKAAHLEAIEKTNDQIFGEDTAATACTAVSLKFAIDVLNLCDTNNSFVVAKNVKSILSELKQQLQSLK
jgi:hypothetical protein